MGKAAAKRVKRTTTNKSEDPSMDYFAGFDAKSQLLLASANIGWRLAIMILLPLFIGVQLDKKFESSPSLTLAAFFIAIFGAGVIINQAYKDINKQTEEAIKSSKNRGRKK